VKKVGSGSRSATDFRAVSADGIEPPSNTYIGQHLIPSMLPDVLSPRSEIDNVARVGADFVDYIITLIEPGPLLGVLGNLARTGNGRDRGNRSQLGAPPEVRIGLITILYGFVVPVKSRLNRSVNPPLHPISTGFNVRVAKGL